MNLDAAQALLLVILAFCLRDGLLAWYLIARTAHAPTPPAGAPPVQPPVTGPVSPPVALPPPAAVPQPRFTGITATSFGGPGDSNASAYGGLVDPSLPGVALPYHFPGARPVVRVFYGGKSVDCPVVDVGPWNINDPYWNTGSRPEAESGIDNTGRKTNLAGIDLTPAAWAALGVSDPNSAKQKVSWDFVSVLDAAAPAPTPAVPAPPVGATPPWLTLARSLVGKSAAANGPEIKAWAAAIAAKYPDMASYCAQYTDPSIPWCGLFAAYVLAMNGVRPVFGPSDTDKFLWAPAWDTFGAAVSTPQPGDIMRFSWSGGGEHVTFYDHEVDDNSYHCTGGNQGNHVVSTEAMPMSAIVAIRRPPS